LKTVRASTEWCPLPDRLDGRVRYGVAGNAIGINPNGANGAIGQRGLRLRMPPPRNAAGAFAPNSDGFLRFARCRRAHRRRGDAIGDRFELHTS
jgi:hypothetical protein